MLMLAVCTLTASSLGTMWHLVFNAHICKLSLMVSGLLAPLAQLHADIEANHRDFDGWCAQRAMKRHSAHLVCCSFRYQVMMSCCFTPSSVSSAASASAPAATWGGAQHMSCNRQQAGRAHTYSSRTLQVLVCILIGEVMAVHFSVRPLHTHFCFKCPCGLN